jgi:hypothetical protein
VAADAAMPLELLEALLTQLAAAGSTDGSADGSASGSTDGSSGGSVGSSSSSSSSGGSGGSCVVGLARLPPALACGVVAAVGSLVQYQDVCRDARVAGLVRPGRGAHHCVPCVCCGCVLAPCAGSSVADRRHWCLLLLMLVRTHTPRSTRCSCSSWTRLQLTAVTAAAAAAAAAATAVAVAAVAAAAAAVAAAAAAAALAHPTARQPPCWPCRRQTWRQERSASAASRQHPQGASSTTRQTRCC